MNTLQIFRQFLAERPKSDAAGILRPAICLIWLFVAGMLSACTTLPPLSPPANSDQRISATQWLQVRHAQQTVDAICLLEINGNALQVVVTTPQGQTLLKATLNAAGELTSEMPSWLKTSGLDPEAITRDIQIALWPAEALRQQGWQIDEPVRTSTRIVTLHGVEWAQIRYQGDRLQPQRIEINRGDGLYTVELRTLEWTTL